MDATKFGLFVARTRKDKNMTQAELAIKINVTDKAVSRWERGLGFPDINTLEPLAEALGVSVLELMKSEKIETDDIQCEDATQILKDTIQEANSQRLLNKKQYKMITIGIAILFLIVSVLLIFGLTRGRYVTLIQCEDFTQRASVESILSTEGIPYKLSSDDLTITVLDVHRSRANIALGANNFRCAAYITDNDFQVEIKLKDDIIACFDEIDNAIVNIYTLSNEEKCINILLELQSDLSAEMIEYLVASVSGATGITNADNIEIVDTYGNVLYSQEQLPIK